MAFLRNPLPRRAKSATIHNKRPHVEGIGEDNKDNDENDIVRVINVSLSSSLGLLNEELNNKNKDILQLNEELKNLEKTIDKKERLITATLKEKKSLKEEVKEKDKIIDKLNTKLEASEGKILNLEYTLKTYTHSKHINGNVKNKVIIQFPRNTLSFMCIDTDVEGIEMIDFMLKKAHMILGEYPKEFFIKSLDNVKQLVLGVLAVKRTIDKDVSCMICEKKFRDTMYGSIAKAPYGVMCVNTSPNVKVGPLCGFHKSTEDGTVTPLNFMVKPGTFDCIL